MKITKTELRNIMNEKLETNKYGNIDINGLTIYYDAYKICSGFLDNNDFWIDFHKNGVLVCTFRSYVIKHMRFDFETYEIINVEKVYAE